MRLIVLIGGSLSRGFGKIRSATHEGDYTNWRTKRVSDASEKRWGLAQSISEASLTHAALTGRLLPGGLGGLLALGIGLARPADPAHPEAAPLGVPFLAAV